MAIPSKLAVILHADVVDSTALVHTDERLAHERIQGAFQQFSETIHQYGGKAHEVRGDAIVAEFKRASDAVSASLTFQAENRARNECLSRAIRPEIRIGIALGEVIIADRTVTGAGVVLAQRIEQLAQGGSICISSAVHEAIPKRLPVRFNDLGENTIKGFDDPVRVFSVTLRPGEALPPPSADAPCDREETQCEIEDEHFPQKPSIAVLPFRNLSSDPDQDYFSDGMTEDIVTTLSKISGLVVISRHSTTKYKGQSVDLTRVGREQGVQYVLEGSVRSSGSRIRITSQLIDTSTGRHVWADRYDRSLEDIFAVQDEITRRITIELQVQLTEGEQARAWSGSTESLEAWRDVVRASELLSSNIKEDTLAARRLANAALASDPKFVSAWTVLGWTYWQEARHGWCEAPEIPVERIGEAAQAALELEPENPDGLALLGSFYLLRSDFTLAVKTFETAVNLAPNHSWISAMSALVLMYSGMAREAIHRIKRAMRLSPIYPMWFLLILGTAQRLAGDHHLAIDAFKKALEREPESLGPRVGLIATLAQAGQVEQAKAEARDLLQLKPGFTVKDWLTPRPFKDLAQQTLLYQSLVDAGLPE